MTIQILIGFALILTTSLIAGAGFLALEQLLSRYRDWVAIPPHGPRNVAVLAFAIAWVLAIVVISILLWAMAFLGLGVFIGLETAVYFSIVSFTTLGFGDILLPADWRLLAGMAAINGLLMIGLLTAIELLRRRSERLRGISPQ